MSLTDKILDAPRTSLYPSVLYTSSAFSLGLAFRIRSYSAPFTTLTAFTASDLSNNSPPTLIVASPARVPVSIASRRYASATLRLSSDLVFATTAFKLSLLDAANTRAAWYFTRSSPANASGISRAETTSTPFAAAAELRLNVMVSADRM